MTCVNILTSFSKACLPSVRPATAFTRVSAALGTKKLVSAALGTKKLISAEVPMRREFEKFLIT